MEQRIESILEANRLADESICEYCGGSGILIIDGHDGEGHWESGVDIRKCICKIEQEYDLEM